ncbi:synaptic vesicle glycoprotein 2B-like [Lycorma delicatula]|uniref:synaptic vesicle glycoprotein 2B-like n=1 Tax=Lycorma delicatula TaxID=130591 RepID=UPI003F51474C
MRERNNTFVSNNATIIEESTPVTEDSKNVFSISYSKTKDELSNVTNPPTEKKKHHGITHKISMISVTSQQSVDFETAITYTGYGKFNYMLLFIAFPAACSTFFDTSVMSFTLPVTSCDLQLNDFNKGCLNGAIYAGMILSAFLWGFLSDNFGRQRLLVIGYFLDTLCNIGASLSQTFILLLTFKFLSGFVICGPYSIFMAYLSEMFNGKYRDSIIMCSGIFISIGGIILPALAWIIIPQRIHWELFNGAIIINSWRVFILVATLPSFISGILTSFCVESPKFLLAKGRKEEALEVFRTMYSINTGMPSESYPVKRLRDEQGLSTNNENIKTATAAINDEKSNKLLHVLHRAWIQVTVLFRRPYVGHSLIIFGIQFGALMALNNLRLWMPLLFHRIHKGAENLGDSNICDVINLHANTTEVHTGKHSESCNQMRVDSTIYTNMVWVSVLTSVTFVLASYLVRKIGKKKLLIVTYLIGSAAAYAYVWVDTKYTLLISSVFIASMQASTVGILGVTVELFPTDLRAMAVSLTMMFGRFGVLLGSLTMPLFMNMNCWVPFTGIGSIVLGCCISLCILLR